MYYGPTIPITQGGTGVTTGLTALSATNLTSGTLPDARLSSNVPLKNAANVFSLAQSIAKSQSGVTTLGAARLLDLTDTNGSTGNRVELGMGYSGATYRPVVVGTLNTSTSGSTKGTWYVATRDVTTDTAPTERLTVETDGDVVVQTSDLIFATAGKTVRLKEGSNATMGAAVLVGGTVTVSTTAVTANSRIQLTSNVDGGTPGWLRVSARVNGTSFTITSSSGTDTSTVAWLILEPSP